MVQLLSDMLAHMEWADAMIWKSALACDEALGDKELRERFFHILRVQAGYLALFRKEKFVKRKSGDFASLAALREEVAQFHAGLNGWTKTTTEEYLRSPLRIPWFRNAPSTITVEQGLAQVALHSQYHRGQNAARLRQLGCEPPLTDLVAWYLNGRPAGGWQQEISPVDQREGAADMSRVTGLGGVFFKVKDAAKMKEWYHKHLGLDVKDDAVMFDWKDAKHPERLCRTVWSLFPEGTEYFRPGDKSFMLNYRVEDLRSLLDVLRREGVEVVGEIEEYEYGKFAWIMDPEGNKIELWEPLDGKL